MQSQFDLNKFLLNFILKLQYVDLRIELNIDFVCSILEKLVFKYKKKEMELILSLIIKRSF